MIGRPPLPEDEKPDEPPTDPETGLGSPEGAEVGPGATEEPEGSQNGGNGRPTLTPQEVR